MLTQWGATLVIQLREKSEYQEWISLPRVNIKFKREVKKLRNRLQYCHFAHVWPGHTHTSCYKTDLKEPVCDRQCRLGPLLRVPHIWLPDNFGGLLSCLREHCGQIWSPGSRLCSLQQLVTAAGTVPCNRLHASCNKNGYGASDRGAPAGSAAPGGRGSSRVRGRGRARG